MAGLLVGRPVGVLLPWGVIVVAVPWPMGNQPPLATRSLVIINHYYNNYYYNCYNYSNNISNFL